jgi:hypothetical protein
MTDKPVDNKVQLGCGTLIIIAIIVALFSGSSDSRRIKRDLEEVTQRLERLEQKLDALAERLGREPAAARLP